MNGVEWVVVWDTCSLMRDQWVGYQVLRTDSQPCLKSLLITLTAGNTFHL